MSLLFALLVVTTAAYTPSNVFPTRARGGRLYREALYTEASLASVRGFNRNTTVNYFQQMIDHANPSKGTFLQRYWVDTSAWNGTGPAIIYIGGEGPETGSPNGFVQQYGYGIGAIMFTLEHRWYGDSLPGPLVNTALLTSTLSVSAAQEDLKAFVDWATATYLRKAQPTWLIVGGSYAGAMSAWMKVRYPTTFKASWSSSGVVHARFAYTDFDGHIAKVIPPVCFQAISTVFSMVSAQYDDVTTRASLLQKLGTPSYFTKTDIAWMLADGSAMAVQYGGKEALCNSIVPLTADPIGQYVALIREFWGSSFTSSCYYSTACLSNSSMASQWAAAGYCWVYQTCSELGYWQIGYPGSLRLPIMTTEYFIDQCRQAFGPTTFSDTFAFNAKHGGVNPPATNVIALQGSDDPWQTAGVRQSPGPTYPVVLAQCAGCGHCGDLFSPTPNDAPSLTAQRQAIVKNLNAWLGV